jgi:hypothetical protein
MRLTENQKRLLLHSGLFLTLLTLTSLSLYLTFLCSTTDFQMRSLPIAAGLFLAFLLTLVFFITAIFCLIGAFIIFFTHLLPYPADKEEK